MSETVTAPAAAAITCVNHPDVETLLRCNKCGNPICTRCAVLTPVGYRCKDCIRGQQKTFITAVWYDYPVAILTAFMLSLVAGTLLARLGFWLFLFFLAPMAGTLIASVVQWATRRRRGRFLVESAAAALIVAGLLSALFVGNWIGVAIYVALGASAFVARLRGIMVR